MDWILGIFYPAAETAGFLYNHAVIISGFPDSSGFPDEFTFPKAVISSSPYRRFSA
jgi:hypothetical protein